MVKKKNALQMELLTGFKRLRQQAKQAKRDKAKAKTKVSGARIIGALRGVVKTLTKKLNAAQEALEQTQLHEKDLDVRLMRSDQALNGEKAREEQLQCQLAGCLTAAEGWNNNPATPDTWGWSPAYQATLDLRRTYEKSLPLLRILTLIADRYDENRLDDEARKYWGPNSENRNALDPSDIILYEGRGGGTLLTLKNCLEARELLRSQDLHPKDCPFDGSEFFKPGVPVVECPACSKAGAADRPVYHTPPVCPNDPAEKPNEQ